MLRRYLESSIEVGGVAKKSIDDIGFASQLFMNHETQDTHLCRSTVVQLDGSLFQKLLFGSRPLEHAISEITWEFTLTLVLHDEDLKESNESDDLDEPSSRDVTKSSNSGLDGGERSSREVNVPRNSGTEGGVDVSENSKHGNSSVLDFNVTKTVESLLIDSVKEVQGIPSFNKRVTRDEKLEMLHTRFLCQSYHEIGDKIDRRCTYQKPRGFWAPRASSKAAKEVDARDSC